MLGRDTTFVVWAEPLIIALQESVEYSRDVGALPTVLQQIGLVLVTIGQAETQR